jgi:hypothetical protein
VLRGTVASAGGVGRRFFDRSDYGELVCIPFAFLYGGLSCLANEPLSGRGRSSVEFVFNDDLKPDVREQSEKELSA